MKLRNHPGFWAICITFTASLFFVFLIPNFSHANAKNFKYGFTASPDKTLETKPDVQISIDEIIASGFDNPIHMTHAGDGSSRMFVVEQTGKIKVIKDGAVQGTPFLDLSSKIALDNLEQGLLGLAFHPDYSNNGYFYVCYIRKDDYATVISRFSVSISDPDIADGSIETPILVIDQFTRNHHFGGTILFGPNDGYLYTSVGDGGPQGDPDNHAQNINDLLGTILRIDVDGGSPYSIPSSNPFVDKDGLDEIWLYGFRNPWRFSFDRDNGDLYIGDVGYRSWEEIDYLAAGSPGGVNFGWNCKEGSHDFNYVGDCLSQVLVDPIAEYKRSSSGGAVIGGFVYRGAEYPQLVGRYFYADYTTGRIWSLYKQNSNPDSWSIPELELDSDLLISGIGEDEAGELYVLDWGAGTIHRLVDASETTPNLSTSRKLVSTPSADPGEIVSYSISLVNTGLVTDTVVSVIDEIPTGLTYMAGTLQASHGSVEDSSAPELSWQGNLIASQSITITYQAQVTGEVTGSIVNKALITEPQSLSSILAASISVPRSRLNTTKNDFFFPGTQPNDLNHQIPPAADCNSCHTEPVFDKWRGSMKSQAGRDPLFWAALAVANIDAPEAGEYCLRCHAPKGWFEGRSHPEDGSALETNDLAYGVTCSVCHRMVDPLPSSSDEAVSIDKSIRKNLQFPLPIGFVGSSALILDPDDNRRGPFSFNLSHPFHTAYQTDFLSQIGDAVTRSRLCGTCHNVHNPVLSWSEERGQFWPNENDSPAPEFENEKLFPVETTFDEWLYSEFARNGVYAPQFAGDKTDGIVSTCQDCHMTRIKGYGAEPGLNAVQRDCETTGCLPEHGFIGANTWVPELLQDPNWRLNAQSDSYYLNRTISKAEEMLQKAAEINVELYETGTSKTAAVRVTNLTGHKLPTGYPEGRQVWINLKAFDKNNQLVAESGAYNPNKGKPVYDPDTKVYEVKQGITKELAEFLSMPEGESFHFVLNNTVVKDNRIPPQGYLKANYDRPGLRPVGAYFEDGQNWDLTMYSLPDSTQSVKATLYYKTSSSEYIDFLRKNGGVDGKTVGELWEKSKSPPVQMVQVSQSEWTYYPYTTILPFILQE